MNKGTETVMTEFLLKNLDSHWSDLKDMAAHSTAETDQTYRLCMPLSIDA